MSVDSNIASNRRAVVAMSGGVDSSVAALLLHEAGYDVVGVSMQVWDYRQHGGCDSRATCCSPDDFTDARKVAARIGVPYYVFDFEKTFRKEVIDNFVDTYLRGETPNPCIDCNSKVKFKELRNRSATFGCSLVATGHFAIIEERADGFHLMRGVDRDKDQSYFLYNLTQEELASTLFPVGGLTKSEVRQRAREAGLATASKPESQDICFVSGTASEFVTKISGRQLKGAIVSSSGKILGMHQGVHNFTVGQRKGLGIGGTERPLYVVEIDAESNMVVVGDKEDLKKEGFEVKDVNWLSPTVKNIQDQVDLRVIAQLRYRHEGIPVKLTFISKDRVRATFEESWSTVSPGQAAVFYDLENREVLGGGRIV
jgi:tRNA-specific 2-thiouridylase